MNENYRGEILRMPGFFIHPWRTPFLEYHSFAYSKNELLFGLSFTPNNFNASRIFSASNQFSESSSFSPFKILKYKHFRISCTCILSTFTICSGGNLLHQSSKDNGFLLLFFI